MDRRLLTSVLRPTSQTKNVGDAIDGYLGFYGDDSRTQQAKPSEVANQYYDLATDFYEYGWGDSFHFAPIRRGESREHAFAKHEYRMAHKLGIKQNDKVLDVGCGIGGPARQIAAFTHVPIVGLNINKYQISRAEDLTKKAGLEQLCTFVQGDFNSAPFSNEAFDKVYAIEATCHSTNKVQVYGEAFRMLKPGGLFGVYEWCMTSKFDPTNVIHKRIKDEILEGDGLTDIDSIPEVRRCMEAAGFELVEAVDLVTQSEVPWYSVLQPRWTVSDFKITPIGRWATHLLLTSLEVLGLCPSGSVKVHRMLCKGADGLIKGGKEGIFTPMYFMLGRKPGGVTNK